MYWPVATAMTRAPCAWAQATSRGVSPMTTTWSASTCSGSPLFARAAERDGDEVIPVVRVLAERAARK